MSLDHHKLECIRLARRGILDVPDHTNLGKSEQRVADLGDVFTPVCGAGNFPGGPVVRRKPAAMRARSATADKLRA